MLTFIAACHPEAEPLIQHFKLKRRRRGLPFEIYENDDTALILSGIGKAHAATAVGFWAGLRGSPRNEPLINFGIAGHADMAIGAAALAHRVDDVNAGRTWYPAQTFKPPCATQTVWTVDRPESHYEPDRIYDMEAAGICEAGLRFTTAELLQLIKVVSDNRDHSTRDITPTFATELIEKQMETILGVAEEIRKLADSLKNSKADPDLVEAFSKVTKFTVAQGDLLNNLLQRASAVGISPSPSDEVFEEAEDAGEILKRLRDLLYSTPARISGGTPE